MEDPFEKPLSTGDEHLRWPLADVAPEMLEVSVVAVRAQSRSPEPRVVPASPARTQPGFSDDSQTGNDSSRAPDRPVTSGERYVTSDGEAARCAWG